ncbi:copper homeostasis periplasmic binding protein CopC [Sphingomonas sp. ACRSK]|jgi:methionine-rich copper-binding protein CopC|uniref:copper homeostasis periplasmic binding protein CopC n=1 Tax=unclassified Sphingomonas TaxID=196159 RepID=UPI001EF43A55|nr:copper homeostasis periplasmic binding protein CopC [Sphingomonas sp. ACRSK]MCG7349734.1 copper homeostasis periplasmic binding protein CopC [Sphingomonas sp. ACRSK]
MRRFALPAAIALLGLASAAQAHPKLVSASPAPNATVAKPARVALQFSEKLMPKFSGADLMMTGHGGKTHPPMKVAVTAGVANDGQTLVVTPKSPLGPGRYSVAWHVVSADTHRIAGNFAFAVK